MCDNINLELNFLESRNGDLIDILLDTDNIELNFDNYKWVEGRNNRSHGGFVKRIGERTEDKEVHDYKAYLVPYVNKLSFERVDMTENVDNKNNLVMKGSNDPNGPFITFFIDGKAIKYKICMDKLSEITNEEPDNDDDIQAQLSEPNKTSILTPPGESSNNADSVAPALPSLTNAAVASAAAVEPSSSNNVASAADSAAVEPSSSNNVASKSIKESLSDTFTNLFSKTKK